MDSEKENLVDASGASRRVLSNSPNHQLQLAYMRDRRKAAEMQFLHGVPFDQRLSVTRVLNGLAIPSRDVEELARGEANTLGAKLPKLLIQGTTYLARYKEVADMIQDSNNYHANTYASLPLNHLWTGKLNINPDSQTKLLKRYH